jgi:ELWxxDGT repeat protein
MTPFCKLFLLASAGTLLVSTGFSQATLVKDINTKPADFQRSFDYADPFIRAGNYLYFKNVDNAGSELWKTDGTTEGTHRVADINKGVADGYYGGGVGLNGKFLFTGSDGVTGFELWITDGTEAGTSLVKDIAPGPTMSFPATFIEFQGLVYFISSDGTGTLWKTDGTPAGTVPVKSMPGSYGGEIVKTATRMFFTTNAFSISPDNYELWASDGTDAGTVNLHTFTNFAYNLAAAGDKVYIGSYYSDYVNYANSNYQLWSSDGTVSGTAMVHDFGLTYFYDLVPYLDQILITANFDLWISDGTNPGTILLRPGFSLDASVVHNTDLYFTGRNGSLTTLLLKSDGTPAGTEEIVDLGTEDYQFGEIPVINDRLIVSVHSSDDGTEPGISDGTAIGTRLLKDVNPGPSYSNPRGFKLLNGKVVFIANDGTHGTQLWITDGTEAGTTLLKVTNPGTESSYPTNLQVLNNQLFFDATPNEEVDRTVWKTDVSGTSLFSNFDPEVSFAQFMGRRDTVFYYFHGFKFYKLNGFPDGTAVIKDFTFTQFSAYSQVFALGTKTILSLDIDANFEYWVTDGTSAGTKMLKDINPGQPSGIQSVEGIVLNNTGFLFAATDGVSGNELWTSDGTENGTNLLLDIFPGVGDSNPSSFVELNGFVYFSADDGVHGKELWKTDGTVNGTVLFKDIVPGTDGSKATALTKAGNVIFFTAYDQNGWALWKTDGTVNGTVIVKDIFSSTDNSKMMSKLTAAGTRLFFSADDGHGEEPWVSDGTSDGTFMIEITPGAEGSFPSLFTMVNGLTYFRAHDQIWRTDGTRALVEKVADMAPRELVPLNGLLYFPAASADYGVELFSVSTKIDQTITFDPLPSKSPGDPTFVLAASSSSHLPVTYTSSDALVATVSGNVVTIVGSGTTIIAASQAGNENYNAAADVTQPFTVKVNQTITFESISNKTVGDAPFMLTATASSNLAVTYTTTSTRLTLAGSQVTVVLAGRATITAGQEGNDMFVAALPIAQTFCINPPQPIITVTDANTASPTLTSSASGGNQWYLNGVAIAGATTNTLVIDASGMYKVQAHVDDCIGEFSADTPLVVTGLLLFESNIVEAYPNPVDTYLEIRGLKDEVTGHQLYDMTGRPSALKLEKKDDVYGAAVEHLSQGIYLLRIQQGLSARQIKFVKN